MGREDVLKALQAMDDPAVCERLAAGNFSDVPGLALDEHEQSLVRDAAAEYPEVGGFDIIINFFEHKVGQFDYKAFPKIGSAMTYARPPTTEFGG